jgi:hypothetical protein
VQARGVIHRTGREPVRYTVRMSSFGAPRVLAGVALRRVLGASVVFGAISLTPPAAAASTGDVLVEFHFKPVPRTQIAIWIEDAEGTFVQDVFVTQSTGTLGIGNRPGRWDFLSSWRFPYGPRPQVLPVWAHSRGRTYPRLRWHDSNEADQDSLGWHESTSSTEPYFCRPLTSSEHDTISTDTMTCPSPQGFSSDKGRFDTPAVSVYPPRADLIDFSPTHDHPDIQQFKALNDLDAVTGATPSGDTSEVLSTIVAADAATGPLVAWIEVNLEYDGNPHWDFDRENDHFVDPRLPNFGIPYMGQPSVVYRVEFDPLERKFRSSDGYYGYGQWNGTSGTIHPPDGTISTADGSGADRLELFTKNGETFRFGVYSYGEGSGDGEGTTEDDPDDDPDDGWGRCRARSLPAMVDLELEPVDFDRVRVHFTVPKLDDEAEIRRVVLYYRRGKMPLSDDNAGSAIQSYRSASACEGEIEPGTRTWCEVTELFGNYDYQIGIRYEDTCGNSSSIVADSVTTPQQKFAQVEGLCFVATAAWGAPWATRVQALRWFRDLYMKTNGVGYAFVTLYTLHSPVAARAIARNVVARRIAAIVLAPLANLAATTTAP